MIYLRCLRKMRKIFAVTVWSMLGTVMLTNIVSSAASAATADDVTSTPVSIPASTSAAQLRQQYEALRTKLANSPFKRPLVIESRQGSSDIKGEIYAVTKHPFAIVSASLGSAQSWCEILILHLNTKYCRIQDDHAGSTVPDGDSAVLLLNVGKKFDQPLADSFRLIFDWRAVQRKADFLQVVMSAESGPLGTHNYRIVLEAVPINADTTFVHLSYAYGFGISSKLVMKAYLATIGQNKVGFTITGKEPDGQPTYIDGMLGLVERNTMRYHLAVEAYLDALALPRAAQFEKRITEWFAASERYPRQLHEIEQRAYLDMKRFEYRRQHQPL